MSSKKGDSPSKKSPLKKLGDAFRKNLQALSISEKLSEVVQCETQEALEDRHKRLEQDLQKSEYSKTTPGEKMSKKVTSPKSDARCEDEAKSEDSGTAKPSEKTSENSAKPLVEAKSEDSATVKPSRKTSDESAKPLVKAKSKDLATAKPSAKTSEKSAKPPVSRKSEDSASAEPSVKMSEKSAKPKDSATAEPSAKTPEKSAKPLVEAKSEDLATAEPSGKSSEESVKPPVSRNSEDVLVISKGVVAMTLASDKPDTTEKVKPTEIEDGQDPEVVSSPKHEEIITSPPRRNPEPLGATGGADSKDFKMPEDPQPKALAELQTVPKIFKDVDPTEKASDLKRACIEMFKFQGRFTDNQESVEEEINKTAPQLQKAVSNAHSILTKITQFQQNSPRPITDAALKMQNDRMKLMINKSATVFQELENAVGAYQSKIIKMMDETCRSHLEMDSKLEKIVRILCDNRVGEVEEEKDVKFETVEEEE